MPIIRFIGKVSPKVLQLSLLHKKPYVIWENKIHGLKATFELQIVDGEITVIVDVNKFELPDDFKPIFNQAMDMADATINLITFHSGDGYSVSLDQLLLPNGELKDVYCKEHEFPKHVTVISQQDGGLETILQLMLMDRDLSLALRDLTDSLRQAYVSTINAARAIETVRNYFIPKGGERTDGWGPMRDALNATKPYVESIIHASRGPRHGDRAADQGEAAARETTERAWILMNRFLEYKKRGNQPLPLDEFPLLNLTQA